ncbi:hypothetical protein RUM43_006735 [Polyplax serrata]|uniref:Uncharacterized protein n=1 Tax=Polyplax serrata TaxID=468196 RepID=A0AAN8PLE1_POLSC
MSKARESSQTVTIGVLQEFLVRRHTTPLPLSVIDEVDFNFRAVEGEKIIRDTEHKTEGKKNEIIGGKENLEEMASLRTAKMVEKGKDFPGGACTERIKTKLRAFVPLLKIFNIRYFKICNRIILLFIVFSFLMNSVLGDLVQGMNSKIVVNNQSVAIGNKLFSSKSDIFYNNTTESVNIRNQNSTNICLKEHRIKERDVREDEGFRLRRRKERIGIDRERKLGLGNLGSLTEDEDDLSRGSKEAAGGSGSECNSCARERIRSKSLEAIKDSILSKLGMSQPPNVTERRKPKIADHMLMTLLRRRHSHHGSNGLYWIVQDDDLDEMQGDEPYDTRSSDKVSSKNSDFSNKSNFLRSRGNASDNKYSDSSEFQEGEVLMEEEDDYHVRTERIVAFSQPQKHSRSKGDVKVEVHVKVSGHGSQVLARVYSGYQTNVETVECNLI